MGHPPTLRPARKSDAANLAVLIDMAGHGLPAWLWQQAVERGEAISAFEIGRTRALREEGGFSFRNAFVIEHEGEVAGMLLGYRQDDPYETGDLEELSSVLRPLVELESQAPGSWYVNAVAVFSEHRGSGFGKVLLGLAEEQAVAANADKVSLIVEDTNSAAIGLYLSLGYGVAARRPFVPFTSTQDADEWLLMTKAARE